MSNLKENEEEYYTTNTIAGIIKAISVFGLIIGIIISVICSQYLETYTIVLIVAIIILAIFIYAIGELIGIMHDLRTNTEHIRDYLERENKK